MISRGKVVGIPSATQCARGSAPPCRSRRPGYSSAYPPAPGGTQLLSGPLIRNRNRLKAAQFTPKDARHADSCKPPVTRIIRQDGAELRHVQELQVVSASSPTKACPSGVFLFFVGTFPPCFVFFIFVFGNRFSYRSWGGGYLACVQEVRDAVNLFRHSGAAAAAAADPTELLDAAEQEQQQRKARKFTIAVADTFGEGGPVRRSSYM